MGSALSACTPLVQQKRPVVPNGTGSINSLMPQVSLNLKRSAQSDTKRHFSKPLYAPI